MVAVESERTRRVGRGPVGGDEKGVKGGLNRQRRTARVGGCDPESDETRQEDVVCADAPEHKQRMV